MRTIRATLLAGLLALALAAPATAAPQWRLEAAGDTTVAALDDPSTPGFAENEIEYLAQARNVGDASTNGGQIRLEARLPAGIQALSVTSTYPTDSKFLSCADAADGVSPVAGAQAVSCTITQPIIAQGFVKLELLAAASAGVEGTVLPEFEVSGGGTVPASVVDPTRIAAVPSTFGVDAFDALSRADASGAVQTEAGSHPHDYLTQLDFNTLHSPALNQGHLWPTQAPRDVGVELPPGFVGNPTVLGSCTSAELVGETKGAEVKTLCPASSQVGTVAVRMRTGFASSSVQGPLPLFNMVPSTGSPARFGFNVAGTSVTLDAQLRSGGDYGLTVNASRVSTALAVAGTSFEFWGVPAADDRTPERSCPGDVPVVDRGSTCPSGTAERPFFRLPTSCGPAGEGIETTVRMDSWEQPGDFVAQTIATHEAPGYPLAPSEWGEEVGIEGCESVPVKGKLTATPTAIDTETPSGLAVHVEVPNPGLENPSGIASSDIKRVKVTLPEGMSVNPSQAEGLGACSPAQYASTRLEFHPDGAHGCPSDSKIGTVEVKTPLLAETIPGDVYIAQPHQNPFNSLLALYVVLHNEQRGILVKLAGRVDTDPATGQIATTFDDLPQLPFSSFDFAFRQGARAPLATPSACGRYTTRAEFTGHADPDGPPLLSTSDFEITRGIGGSACPSGSLPPFNPGLIAGTRNNAAGSHSPFDLRLFRTDAEQQFTNFSIKLPPGITGKLAGVGFCSDASIEAARHRSGADEIASPSCPDASYVGKTLVGAGVGPVQTYVPGKVYLAGPYNGSTLSIAAITAAKVGPFDLGTVVIREALRVDPTTAEVFVDPTGSDPLPHIIEGIPTKLRDIRAYVDRPDFVLNPTSCAPTSTASTVLGSGLDFASPVDDEPVTVSTRFQAADCAALGFKPRLAIRLFGKTKRGGNPKLRAVYRPRPGDANTARAQVTLPRSAFLDQSHIGTVCTRVQYAADACPARSVYGRAVAHTPILDEALKGPVYLRSSEHKLPDMVASLKSGKIEIDLVGRIDSLRGRIRSTFEAVPDAPVSRFVLIMKGGKKSLIQNSANLCKGTQRAIVALDAQNGKIRDFRPKVRASCGKAKQHKRHRRLR